MSDPRYEARKTFWAHHDKEEYECPKCGRPDLRYYSGTVDTIHFPVGFHVHHKDGDPTNNDLENLVALCPTCHKLIEHGSVRKDEQQNLRENLPPRYRNPDWFDS